MIFKNTKRKSWTIAAPIILIVATILGIVVTIGGVKTSQDAAALSNFDRGNIISNSVMSNHNAMSESQIRNFINQRNSSCSGSLCLKNYRQGGKDAARMIYEAAQEQRINPQVLLATLQKEQGLVTHTNPQQWMYRSAMGYGCPDSTPGVCDSQYNNFMSQMIWGATFFRAHLDGLGSWSNRYRSGSGWWSSFTLGTNDIQWSPNASCGTTRVNIQNRATQALYSYTPYTPNQAALSAGYGSGNGCSAYGNRNFYLYMRDWFNKGVPRFSALSDVRFMETRRETAKVDVETEKTVGGSIAAGAQIRFATKAKYDGRDCLRTQVDTGRDVPYCIPIADLREVDITPTAIPSTTMMLDTSASKYDMRRNTSVGGKLDRYRLVTVEGEFMIAGIKFYVTRRDMDEGFEYGFREAHVKEASSFTNMDRTYMRTTGATSKIVPTTGVQISRIDGDEVMAFNSYVDIEGDRYYRLSEDRSRSLNMAIPGSMLQPLEFQSFASPRWMRLSTDLRKQDLTTGTSHGVILRAGQEVFFDSKITIGGREYFRTAHDTRNGNPHVIRADRVTGSLLNSFTSFHNPRTMTAQRNTQKVDLYTGRAVQNSNISQGTRIGFGDKITRNGVEYFRTNTDSNRNVVWVIPARDLR